MKILIAADLYWPTINGVATFSRNLALGLASRGHEVLVVAPSQRRSGLSGEEMDENVLVKRTVSIPFPFYQNFRISVSPRREIKKIIEDFEPDVVHIQMLLGIGQATMRYANRYNIPVVATNHAIPENLLDNIRMLARVSKPLSYIITEYGARFHAKADYVTMPTQAAIDMLAGGRELPDLPIEPVSNGIDLSKFKPSRPKASTLKKFGIPANATIISYIGRLDAEKHVDVLLNAFNEVLLSTDQSVHLLVVGFGTEEDRLKNQAYELGIDRKITFTGRVSDEEIVELHKVGTVFCMPSPSELQCISALEAMASGKPLVAVDAGAVPELCQEGKNGYLCEKDDVHQIAESLQKLVEDPAKCRKFGKSSLEIAKTHDIQHTLERFESIYQQVTSAKTHVVPQRLL